MRLQNTPPKGAGKSQGVTKTERLLQIIEGLGQDKATFLPLGIRTSDLAERAGVPRGSVQALLAPYVDSGRLQWCKVSVPGSPPQNEYRSGAGVATPEFKSLDARRAGIARNTAHVRPASSGVMVDVSRTAATCAPEVPVFLKNSSTIPQAQVGNSASRQEGTPLDTPPAVSAVTTPGSIPESTPKPAAKAALNEEPTARPASAGAVLRLAIDQDGSLQMGDEDDPARWVLTPAQVLALGDFLHGTQGVWRP